MRILRALLPCVLCASLASLSLSADNVPKLAQNAPQNTPKIQATPQNATHNTKPQQKPAPNLVRDFELFKLDSKDRSAPTLLLMGGIHGNEAGAYFATDLFLRHYRILKGSVWLVPVVNPHGMFANMRGVYGDMNRKFAALAESDPDFHTIAKIKKLLAEPEIDISMHLHDGSGYWRPTYINAQQNPHKWGNCSVVDQPRLEGAKYGEIESYVAQMVADINQHITNPLYRYHVHNTETKKKHDVEQLKALTFYSLSLGKPALTNEASKELDVPTRVYYHLIAIESLLGQLGIEFERDFALNIATIKSLLGAQNFEARIGEFATLPLDSLRPNLSKFPMPKDTEPKALRVDSATKLLGILSARNGALALQYGYHTLSTLQPEYREFDLSLKSVNLIIDGIKQEVKIGSLVHIKDSLEFAPQSGYRVNVIGYVKPNSPSGADESGITIYKKDFIPSFSLDTRAQVYRAEIYKLDTDSKDSKSGAIGGGGEKFSGMITLSFAPANKPRARNFELVRYTPAPHSPLAQKLALNNKTESKEKTESKPAPDSTPPKDSNPKDTQTAQASTPNNPQIAQAPKEKDSKDTQADSKEHTMLAIKSPLGVNLRAKPSTQALIMAKLPQYTQVRLLEQEGKWSKVALDSTNTSMQGYVISSALSAYSITTPKTAPQVQSSPPQTTQTIQTTQHASIIAPLAMVRSKPSTNALIIAKAPLGREMDILSYVSGEDGQQWAKIYYVFEGKSGRREIRGYVAKRLLKPLP